MSLPSKEKTTKQQQTTRKNTKQKRAVTRCSINVPECDPNAPATSMDRCTSGQEQEQGRAKQQGEQREHPRPAATTTKERAKRRNPQTTTKKRGPGGATTGGGAGSAEGDRAEKAAHITLE